MLLETPDSDVIASVAWGRPRSSRHTLSGLSPAIRRLANALGDEELR